MSEDFAICWRPKSGGVLVTQLFKNSGEFRRWIEMNVNTRSRFHPSPSTDGLQEELQRHGSKLPDLDPNF